MPASWRRPFSDKRVGRFWYLGLLALLFHGILDPAVSYLAVSVLGAGQEANPWLAGPLDSGILAVLLVHLPLYGLCLGVLCACTWLFAHATPTEQAWAYRFSLIAWTLIIVWGVVLVGNNLLIVVTGLG